MLCDFTDIEVQKMHTKPDGQKTDRWRPESEVAGSGEEGIQKGHREAWSMGTIHHLDHGGGFTVYTYVKTNQIEHFKCMQFIFHSYLNKALEKFTKQ